MVVLTGVPVPRVVRQKKNAGRTGGDDDTLGFNALNDWVDATTAIVL